eukprot:m.38035 g.38035  ORF g.38035 m.38035 type:complete len:53 (+) comp9382_c0_seq1:3455-3613(+)
MNLQLGLLNSQCSFPSSKSEIAVACPTFKESPANCGIITSSSQADATAGEIP